MKGILYPLGCGIILSLYDHSARSVDPYVIVNANRCGHKVQFSSRYTSLCMHIPLFLCSAWYITAYHKGTVVSAARAHSGRAFFYTQGHLAVRHRPELGASQSSVGKRPGQEATPLHNVSLLSQHRKQPRYPKIEFDTRADFQLSSINIVVRHCLTAGLFVVK